MLILSPPSGVSAEPDWFDRAVTGRSTPGLPLEGIHEMATFSFWFLRKSQPKRWHHQEKVRWNTLEWSFLPHISDCFVSQFGAHNRIRARRIDPHGRPHVRISSRVTSVGARANSPAMCFFLFPPTNLGQLQKKDTPPIWWYEF